MTDEGLPRSREELEDLAQYYSDHDVSEEVTAGELISEPMATTSLRLPDSVIRSLKADAKKQGVPYTRLVRQILVEHVRGKTRAWKGDSTATSDAKPAIHVVPDQHGSGWRVVREGQKRAIARAATQKAAARRGRAVAQEDKVGFSIHGRDGRVRVTWTYTETTEEEMAKGDIHVTPDDKGKGWKVVREGQDRVIARTDTQAQAAERGRQAARNSKVEFNLHGKDGRVREKDSYGKDPRSIKG